jgi:hypothetical protein
VSDELSPRWSSALMRPRVVRLFGRVHCGGDGHPLGGADAVEFENAWWCREHAPDPELVAVIDAALDGERARRRGLSGIALEPVGGATRRVGLRGRA